MTRVHVAVVAATLAAPLAVPAYVGMVTDQGLALSWPGSCVVYHINEKASADVPTEKTIAAIDTAFDTWSQADGSYLRFQNGGLTSLETVGVEDSPRNIVMWREDPADWVLVDADIVGITTVTYDAGTGRILDADIEMNGVFFEFSVEIDAGQMDVQAAVTHEVGHLLGLDHSETPAAVMHPNQAVGEAKRSLDSDDMDGVRALYPSNKDPGMCDTSLVGAYYPRPSGGGGCQAAGGSPSGAPGAPLALLALALVGACLWRARSAGIVALFVACLFAGVLWAPPAAAYVLYTSPDDSSVPLRWYVSQADVYHHSHPPLDIVAEDARAVVEQSFSAWAALNCEAQLTPFTFNFVGVLSDAVVGYDQADGATNQNLVKWVSDPVEWARDPAHASDVVALTSLTYDRFSGEVIDADMEMNNVNFTFGLTGKMSEADLANTVVHETGHFVGLDHSFKALATMYRKAPLGETLKRDLTNDDVAGYCALYGPNAIPKPVLPPNDADSKGCAGAPGSGGGPAAPLLMLMSMMLFGLWTARRLSRAGSATSACRRALRRAEPR